MKLSFLIIFVLFGFNALSAQGSKDPYWPVKLKLYLDTFSGPSDVTYLKEVYKLHANDTGFAEKLIIVLKEGKNPPELMNWFSLFVLNPNLNGTGVNDTILSQQLFDSSIAIGQRRLSLQTKAGDDQFIAHGDLVMVYINYSLDAFLRGNNQNAGKYAQEIKAFEGWYMMIPALDLNENYYDELIQIINSRK